MTRSYAMRQLRFSEEFPYDDPASMPVKDPPPPATDWAHAAARGVITDLMDRKGIKQGFYDVDDEVRVEIVASLAEIIRTAESERKELQADLIETMHSALEMAKAYLDADKYPMAIKAVDSALVRYLAIEKE